VNGVLDVHLGKMPNPNDISSLAREYGHLCCYWALPGHPTRDASVVCKVVCIQRSASAYRGQPVFVPQPFQNPVSPTSKQSVYLPAAWSPPFGWGVTAPRRAQVNAPRTGGTRRGISSASPSKREASKAPQRTIPQRPASLSGIAEPAGQADEAKPAHKPTSRRPT